MWKISALHIKRLVLLFSVYCLFFIRHVLFVYFLSFVSCFIYRSRTFPFYSARSHWKHVFHLTQYETKGKYCRSDSLQASWNVSGCTSGHGLDRIFGITKKKKDQLPLSIGSPIKAIRSQVTGHTIYFIFNFFLL